MAITLTNNDLNNLDGVFNGLSKKIDNDEFVMSASERDGSIFGIARHSFDLEISASKKDGQKSPDGIESLVFHFQKNTWPSMRIHQKSQLKIKTNDGRTFIYKNKDTAYNCSLSLPEWVLVDLGERQIARNEEKQKKITI